MSQKGENIYLRRDGRWEGRFSKGRENGKLRFGYVFGHSYRETKEKLLAAKISWQSRCEEKKRRNETLEAVSAMWLSESTRFLKESTVAKYHEYLDYYILPELGTLPVDSITTEKTEALFHRLRTSGGKNSRGLAAQTLASILRILKKIKEYALRLGFTVRFSLENLSIKRRQKALRIFSEDEWGRLESFLKSRQTSCHGGILLAMWTGIRIGELCALRWDDISLTLRQIHIHQTLQRIRDISGNGSKTRIIITPPKSESANRVIPLPDALCEYLKPLCKAGACFLTNEAGKYIEPKTMERRFKAILKTCEIETATFHVLRHTFATRCVEAGFDPKCLSAILGHADVSVTFNRYVHPTMEMKRRNMMKFMKLAI